jgi:hypothetical protein
LADDGAGTLLPIVDPERACSADIGDPFRHDAASRLAASPRTRCVAAR